MLLIFYHKIFKEIFVSLSVTSVYYG